VRVRLYPSEKVVEIRSAQIPDGGIVTTYTDITETVAAEEALERANETLERRVIERTEELTRLNSELLHAKAEADEANSSKTRFLAAASHDILQPLNAARLYVTALVERPQETVDPQLIGNIDSALEAVEDILGALLDISRLDAGAMKPELITFAIDDVLGPLCREFESVAKAKNLSLQYVKSSFRVHSDRRLLRRLLQNLISNAIKYTPSGKIVVGCRKRGQFLQISVVDNGIGIPLSKQKVIFEEFQRLDQGARVARGLGLGLSIVESISRVLDHKVDVKSLPGKGSTFSTIVPISAAPAQTIREVEQPRSSKTPLSGMVVVCIDNEPAILDGMRIVLEGWGCIVITGASSESARAALRTANQAASDSAFFITPDLIIADYHLDDEDGLSVIGLLRRQWGADIKAVLLTADRSPHMRSQAAEAEIHVMNKPLKPAALRAFMAQVRSQSQS
jgi:signal transduction histidine kinase